MYPFAQKLHMKSGFVVLSGCREVIWSIGDGKQTMIKPAHIICSLRDFGSVVLKAYLGQRAASPLSTCQFTASISCRTFNRCITLDRVWLWTREMVRAYWFCRGLQEPVWYNITFDTFPLWNITCLSMRAAMQMITATNSLSRDTTIIRYM